MREELGEICNILKPNDLKLHCAILHAGGLYPAIKRTQHDNVIYNLNTA